MSVVIRLKVPNEMHYTVIPTGTYKVNSSRQRLAVTLSERSHRLNQIVCNEQYNYLVSLQVNCIL